LRGSSHIRKEPRRQNRKLNLIKCKGLRRKRIAKSKSTHREEVIEEYRGNISKIAERKAVEVASREPQLPGFWPGAMPK